MSDLRDFLETTNELDANGEPANVVDGLFAISHSIDSLADAVRETGFFPNSFRATKELISREVTKAELARHIVRKGSPPAERG